MNDRNYLNFHVNRSDIIDTLADNTAQLARIEGLCIAEVPASNTPYVGKALVETELGKLLPAGVKVTIIDEMSDPNLIGATIAALS